MRHSILLKLVSCMFPMYVQSMEPGKGISRPDFSFYYFIPISIPKATRPKRSIIPSANPQQNRRVYLFNIIYADFSPTTQISSSFLLPSKHFYAKMLFDAVLHMKIMWLLWFTILPTRFCNFAIPSHRSGGVGGGILGRRWKRNKM